MFRLQQAVSKKTYAIVAVLGFLCFGAIWQGLSMHYAKKGKAVLFPSPVVTYNSALDYVGYGTRTEKALEKAQVKWEAKAPDARPDWAEVEADIRADYREELETLWGDVRVSFIRVTSAFLLAVVIALPVGLYLGSFNILEGFIQPVTEFSRYVPVPALVPLLIVLFGIGEAPKIALIFIGTFFQLMLMIKEEVRRVPPQFVQAAATMGATKHEILFKVLAPSAMPGIFDAFRMCNGWAWTWLIVAELVAANEGLGFRILRFQRFLQTDRIFVYLIILGLIGLLLDVLFRLFNKWLFKWEQKK